MATSTFERKIVVTDPKAIAKLSKIMSDETPSKPITRSPLSREKRVRGGSVIKAVSITLSSLIEATGEDNELLQQILSSFSCEKDSDIEYFLHSRAVEFERLGKARTYLLCDEDQLSDENFCLDQLIIYGYIALALKVLSVPDDVSNRKKELDGLSGKIHGTPIDSFPCYLIGQLARNSKVEPDSLSGERLLQEAYDNIYTATEAVGGRYMLIECREEDKLIKFYSENGFEEFTRMSDGEHIQVQMIRKI